MNIELLEQICDIRSKFDTQSTPSASIDRDLIKRFLRQVSKDDQLPTDCGVANWRDNVWSNDRWRDSHRK